MREGFPFPFEQEPLRPLPVPPVAPDLLPLSLTADVMLVCLAVHVGAGLEVEGWRMSVGIPHCQLYVRLEDTAGTSLACQRKRRDDPVIVTCCKSALSAPCGIRRLCRSRLLPIFVEGIPGF